MLCFLRIDTAVESADWYFKENKWTWLRLKKGARIETGKLYRPSKEQIRNSYISLRNSCKEGNCYAESGRLAVNKWTFLGIPVYMYFHETTG